MPMSDEHREALRRGREEARVIKEYLEALERRRPGRPITADSVKHRIAALQAQIDAEASPLKRVELLQRRIDAEHSLAAVEDAPDIAGLESAFVACAKSYSERKGISYAAWREGGVPAATLRKAGLSRSS